MPYPTIQTVDENGNVITPLEEASTIHDGSATVTTAGTAAPLIAAPTPCISVAICAKTTNTGVIAVGGSTVVASSSTRRGIPLSPGDSVSLDIADVSQIYIDATVSGDGVTYTYLS
jgi:hypothetical protein